MMKESRFSVVVIALLAVFLIACGSGDSSSGGSTSDSGAGKNVDRYTGSEALTISVPSRPRVAPSTRNYGLTIEIEGKFARIMDAEGFVYRGYVEGAKIRAGDTVDLGYIGDGIRCKSVPYTYNGVIRGNNISGTSLAMIPCTKNSVTLIFRIRGKFSVNRVAKGLLDNGNRDENLADAVRNHSAW
jgi:hypothetical protein